jgi:hypothetical protein
VGIPASRHGRVWELLAQRAKALDGGEKLNSLRPSYNALLGGESSYRHAIRIDLNRTFPDEAMFQSAAGKECLFNCMQAYSVLDEDVGYCQGLAFLGGLLLFQLTEEAAFDVLVTVMYARGVRNQYFQDMGALKKQLYQLTRMLHDELPNVFAHFEKHGIDPFLYATPWFLTIFSSTFHVGFATRVVDLLLVHGLNALFWVALALLASSEEQLCECANFETTARYLQRGLPEYALKHLDEIFARARVFASHPPPLAAYDVEYAVLDDAAALMNSPEKDQHDSPAVVPGESAKTDSAETIDMLRAELAAAHKLNAELTCQVNTLREELAEARVLLQKLSPP